MSDQKEHWIVYAAAGAMNGRHPSNDQGTEESQPAERDRPGEIPVVLWSAIDTLETAVEGLREQLRNANRSVSARSGPAPIGSAKGLTRPTDGSANS